MRKLIPHSRRRKRSQMRRKVKRSERNPNVLISFQMLTVYSTQAKTIMMKRPTGISEIRLQWVWASQSLSEFGGTFRWKIIGEGRCGARLRNSPIKLLQSLQLPMGIPKRRRLTQLLSIRLQQNMSESANRFQEQRINGKKR